MREELGDLLRELRLRAGLTIEGLAGASGVSVRAISDTERGRSRTPRPRTVTALTAALGLDRDDADAFAALARSGRGTVAAGRPRAGELPRRTVAAAGRPAALAEIGGWITTSPPDGPALVVVLHGLPGVGKTALAVRLAERHRYRFPGGAFYADLRAGTEPETVLLRALGMGARLIAADRDERAGQLRALLGRRRCLLVLDGAAGEAQVRALLPGTGCVLITSRRSLAGLEAVRRYPVAPLPPTESAPLPPGRSPAPPGTSGGIAFPELGTDARTMLRGLARRSMSSFGTADAAVAAGCDPITAETLLEDLLDLGLLQPDGADHYRLPDAARPFIGPAPDSA
ncbi:helix-turn-helix domain-containing protein [Catenuloplanes indicus]|uniref:Transcriptional regulator with XRE-family HTH domain n=1 Tax=Catenuloplanes indicus TaxID=137267 RepID=A0AAE3VVR5_9ACTN|nr:helix-turn-helix domain-containing protein [Catenuloplanes indicus]MDQ0364550.1 transcriptional regulator with XRE-family HTH domain [Catenuloplanes indicus]